MRGLRNQRGRGAERTARLKGKGVSDVDVEKLTDILSSRSAPQNDEGV